jgi:hypothetical protein
LGAQTPATSPLLEIIAEMICAWPRLTNCTSEEDSPHFFRQLRAA